MPVPSCAAVLSAPAASPEGRSHVGPSPLAATEDTTIPIRHRPPGPRAATPSARADQAGIGRRDGGQTEPDDSAGGPPAQRGGRQRRPAIAPTLIGSRRRPVAPGERCSERWSSRVAMAIAELVVAVLRAAAPAPSRTARSVTRRAGPGAALRARHERQQDAPPPAAARPNAGCTGARARRTGDEAGDSDAEQRAAGSEGRGRRRTVSALTRTTPAAMMSASGTLSQNIARHPVNWVRTPPTIKPLAPPPPRRRSRPTSPRGGVAAREWRR